LKRRGNPESVQSPFGFQSDRTVTLEAYAAEIAKTRQERPQLQFILCDHSFEGNRA